MVTKGTVVTMLLGIDCARYLYAEIREVPKGFYWFCTALFFARSFSLIYSISDTLFIIGTLEWMASLVSDHRPFFILGMYVASSWSVLYVYNRLMVRRNILRGRNNPVIHRGSNEGAEESRRTEDSHHIATLIHQENEGIVTAEGTHRSEIVEAASDLSENENMQLSSAVAGPPGTDMIIPQSGVPVSVYRNCTIRSILKELFHGRMPQECILIILKEVLCQLSDLHAQGRVHNMVSAGHVYYEKTVRDTAAILLGVPLVVGHDAGPSSMKYGDPELISQWGGAPEIANSVPTSKSDVWLLGIMALEMALGELNFRNSQEVYDHVLAMQKEGKISRPWIRLPFGFFKIKLHKPCSFSRPFHRVVLRCLDLNPDKRATANDLLQDEAFTTLTSDVSFLSEVIKETDAQIEAAKRAKRDPEAAKRAKRGSKEGFRKLFVKTPL